MPDDGTEQPEIDCEVSENLSEAPFAQIVERLVCLGIDMQQFKMISQRRIQNNLRCNRRAHIRRRKFSKDQHDILFHAGAAGSGCRFVC